MEQLGGAVFYARDFCLDFRFDTFRNQTVEKVPRLTLRFKLQQPRNYRSWRNGSLIRCSEIERSDFFCTF